MPKGKLRLRVFDVYGKPIGERADVLLKNLTLSEVFNLRDLDVTKTRVISGLSRFPNGRYSLEIDTLSYHTVSRFVSIPPGGDAAAEITLPVNPKKVVKVDFPKFGAATISADAWSLLDNSPRVLNFNGKTGQDLYDALDDTRRAGFLNLVAKSGRTRFTAGPGNPRSVLSYVEELTELRGDRFFAIVPSELRSQTINSVQDGLFQEVSETLHSPPPGFTPARSFKTHDPAGNLQLSFFSSADGKFAVDLDIDDAQGFQHIFQVVGNFFGGRTHPYNIHEILIASQELDPGYRLRVRV